MSLFFYFTFVATKNILMKKRNLKSLGCLRLGLLALFLYTFLGFTSCNPSVGKGDKKPYLVVLSMDGFRWDYPDKAIRFSGTYFLQSDRWEN